MVHEIKPLNVKRGPLAGLPMTSTERDHLPLTTFTKGQNIFLRQLPNWLAKQLHHGKTCCTHKSARYKLRRYFPAKWQALRKWENPSMGTSQQKSIWVVGTVRKRAAIEIKHPPVARFTSLKGHTSEFQLEQGLEKALVAQLYQTTKGPPQPLVPPEM